MPAWVAGPFYNVTSTADEVSVVCESHLVPEGVNAERGWRILKVVGPFDFGVVGVMASLASPLAQAGVSLIALATFDTDYVLVKAENLSRAVAALTAAGHLVATEA